MCEEDHFTLCRFIEQSLCLKIVNYLGQSACVNANLQANPIYTQPANPPIHILRVHHIRTLQANCIHTESPPIFPHYRLTTFTYNRPTTFTHYKPTTFTHYRPTTFTHYRPTTFTHYRPTPFNHYWPTILTHYRSTTSHTTGQPHSITTGQPY